MWCDVDAMLLDIHGHKARLVSLPACCPLLFLISFLLISLYLIFQLSVEDH